MVMATTVVYNIDDTTISMLNVYIPNDKFISMSVDINTESVVLIRFPIESNKQIKSNYSFILMRKSLIGLMFVIFVLLHIIMNAYLSLLISYFFVLIM